jgi:hypothetical protein
VAESTSRSLAFHRGFPHHDQRGLYWCRAEHRNDKGRQSL